MITVDKLLGKVLMHSHDASDVTGAIIPDLVYKGAYAAGTDYAVGDSVDYQGSSYVMFNDAAAGTLPTNTTYWQVLANKGDTGADSTVPGPPGADGLTTSVNGVTQVGGAITIDPDDLDDTSTTHKFVTSTDITNLGNLDSAAYEPTSAFATATHNHDLAYLGISAKASDSDLLDGHDTAYFQTALGFTPENSANKGQNNGYCPLGAGGKIASTYLDPIAITSTSVVASEAAQLLLTAQEGDVAVRSDEKKTYIHNGGTAGTMADWTLLQTPTDAVLSVDGQTGAVDLSTVYLGLHATADNVSGLTITPGASISGENTGDQDLSGYAPLVSPSFTTPTLGVASATRIGVGVDADANRVFYSVGASTSLPMFENNAAISNDPVACVYFMASRATDMGDGFGVTQAFRIKDNSGVENTIGVIGFVRAGADNSGDFVVRPHSTGTQTERFRVTSAGNASISGGLAVGGSPLVGIASFHGSIANHDSFFGGAYGNTLNFDSEVNADTGAGYINFYGYLGAQTKFRDLGIANGKGTTIAFFDGSSGYMSIGNSTTARTRLDVKNSAATGAAAPNASYDVIVQENNDVCYYNMITPSDKRSGFIFSDDNRGYGGLFYTHGDASFGAGTTDSIVFFAGNAVRGYINATALTLNVGLTVEGNTTLGNASTDTVTLTGRAIFRTAASDPQHATPASRPAGSVGEIVYYSGKMYFCTNAATPTWEKITST